MFRMPWANARLRARAVQPLSRMHATGKGATLTSLLSRWERRLCRPAIESLFGETAPLRADDSLSRRERAGLRAFFNFMETPEAVVCDYFVSSMQARSKELLKNIRSGINKLGFFFLHYKEARAILGKHTLHAVREFAHSHGWSATDARNVHAFLLAPLPSRKMRSVRSSGFPLSGLPFD